MSILAPPSTDEATRRGVRSALISAQVDSSVLGEIAKLIDPGKLKPRVETVLPLSEVRKVTNLMRAGTLRARSC